MSSACFQRLASFGSMRSLGQIKSAWAGASFVHVCKWAGAARVLRSKLGHLEAGRAYEVVHLSIQVTTARNMAPHRGESVLPALDSRLRRQTVLDEEQPAIRFKDPSHLA